MKLLPAGRLSGLFGRRLALLTLAVSAAVTLVACSSGGAGAPVGADAAVAGIAVAERPFVVDPGAGYPLIAAPELVAEVREAYRMLARSGDTGAAERRAEELLAEFPGLHPATVLAAQADLLSGQAASAIERLEPIVAEIPDYMAAQLLLGRAAERADRVPRAYEAFRAVAEESDAAAERAEVLRPRAVEIVANRIADALTRGRVDVASEELARLELWAPEADQTLEAARTVAGARGDLEGELGALRHLVDRYPDRTELALSLAELELAVGDATEGLQRLRALAERSPRDARIQEALERGKFRWRLTLLPRDVQELARRPEITRGEVAVLIHWLIPQVRSARRSGGRIAADILEHPFRDEIARVVNLGLLDVDPTLHTFSPDRPVRRADLLGALLRAVKILGNGVACVEDAPLGRRPTDEAVCTVATQCRILREAGDCLPGATLSGSEALEMIRRSVELLTPPAASDSP